MLKHLIRLVGGAKEALAPFDPALYVAIYPDLAGIDPVAHWQHHGYREGRVGFLPETHRPFDPDFYLGRYPDVADGGHHPYEHWVRTGRAQGRIGVPPADLPPFDPDYYLSRHRGVAEAGVDPYRHWLRFGLREGKVAAWPLDSRGHRPRLRDVIVACGLFDRAYYLSCYHEEIPEGCDPLDHYIAVGQHRGYKPNRVFDPLIYLLRHPETRETGPMLHYLERLHRGERVEEDLTTRSAFPEVRHPDRWPNAHVQPKELLDRDLKDNLAQSEVFGQEQVLEFDIDGKAYRLVAPSAADFFGRLSADKPFAFSRLPHGFWDCLSELNTAHGQIAETAARMAPDLHLTEDEIARLAERACYAVMDYTGVYEENFLRELKREIVQTEPSPDHFRSISFKWQPTVDDRVFGRTEDIGPMELEQMRAFAEFFRPGVPVYESMVWKGWVYSGDVTRLIPEARERPVVLVGAERVKDLGLRWKLPWFSHLEIPLLSYDRRYELLDRCKEAVRQAQAVARANGTKKPLIMLQGGSFACWMIARLHAWDPDAVYLDFGQSLHIWFLDNEELWKYAHWLQFHPRLIMDNCKLDDFYRELGIELLPPFAPPQQEGAAGA